MFIDGEAPKLYYEQRARRESRGKKDVLAVWGNPLLRKRFLQLQKKRKNEKSPSNT